MINPPHILTARLERAIANNIHRRYALHETGQLDYEARLRLDIDFDNIMYWNYKHHSQETERISNNRKPLSNSRPDNNQERTQ